MHFNYLQNFEIRIAFKDKIGLLMQAASKCDREAAHGACIVCDSPRHHGAIPEDERQTCVMAPRDRSCRHCHTGKPHTFRIQMTDITGRSCGVRVEKLTYMGA